MMKPLTFILYFAACLTQIAGAASFNFNEVVGDQRALMMLNFAEACFLQIDHRYEQSSDMGDCVGEGGHFVEYLDEPTQSVAARCSRLNVVKYYYHDPESGGSSFTFRKSYGFLDRDTIVDSRAACAELVRLFEAMPFNLYGSTAKACRKMLGIQENCLRLRQTPTGVVVGFFFFLKADEVSSQCESLKAEQPQPPNLICTWSEARVGPDLRFRSITELSKCPALLPVAHPESCLRE